MTSGPLGPEPVPDELRPLLALRAARARALPPAQDEATLWVAEFAVGGEPLALPLEVLRGAVPWRAVTPVPLAPPHVAGVVRFRGQLLAALSLPSLLGLRAAASPAVLLVVETQGARQFAVDCEQIPRPTGLSASVVREARARSGTHLAQVEAPGGRAVRLLDLELLLDARGLGGPRD